MGAVLGVPTLSYAPFAIFNYASPGLSVLYGLTGFKIEKVEPVVEEPETVEEVLAHPVETAEPGEHLT
jgi:NhaC family Na+:H+ antiporter